MRRIGRPALTVISASLAVMLVFSEAHAQALGALPPQPLADALEVFAKETGYQLVYRTELAAGLQTRGADAGLSIVETLRELLRGTGLTSDFINERTIVIFKAAGGANVSTNAQTPTVQSLNSSGDAAGDKGRCINAGDNNNGEQKMRHRGFFARLTGLFVACGSAASSATAQTETAEPTLETIVITAERREADIQKTALAITAISGESLTKTGISNINDALQSVPSLQITGAGTGASTQAQIAIRGIGTDGNNKSPSTAIYEDGIAVYGLDGYYFDLARVEVLAGPQGTLYGGTATGGAVNFVTNDPKIGQFNAFAQGEIGNYNLYHTTAMVNIPAADSFAIRLAGSWINRDSYASTSVKGTDQRSLRAKALWEPAAELSVLFGAEYFHDTSLNAYSSELDFATGNPIGSAIAPSGNSDLKVQKYYLNVNADLGFGELTYIPGIQIRESDSLIFNENIGSPSSGPNGEYLTQELRLASKPGSKITWVGGLYYFNESSTATSSFGTFITTTDQVNNYQRAVFGQATYPLTDTLRFTGGARYSEDDVDHPQTTNGVATPFTGHYHSFDYLARIEYDLTDKSLLYASFSTGYRPGGIAQAPYEYAHEKIKAYEIGSKNTLMDGALILNGDVFYYNYHGGFQVGVSVPCSLAASVGNENCSRFDVITLPAEFKGAELTVTWAVTRADVLSISPTYIQSRYIDNVLVPVYFGGPVVPLLTKGQPVTHTAKWAANASYQHTLTFGNDSSLFGRIEANYQSKHYTNFDACIFGGVCAHPTGVQLPNNWLQKDYTLVNLSAGYASADQSWQVTAYARNLNNLVYKLGTSNRAALGAPRTYGLTLSKHW